MGNGIERRAFIKEATQDAAAAATAIGMTLLDEYSTKALAREPLKSMRVD